MPTPEFAASGRGNCESCTHLKKNQTSETNIRSNGLQGRLGRGNDLSSEKQSCPLRPEKHGPEWPQQDRHESAEVGFAAVAPALTRQPLVLPGARMLRN